MTTGRRVRRSWDISKRTADSLNKLQLVSGIEKRDLVDISITLLFQTVIAVRGCTGRSSHDIIESIARALPADIRNAEMQVDSGPVRIDFSQLIQLFSGDPSMTFNSAILDEADDRQIAKSTPDTEGEGGDAP